MTKITAITIEAEYRGETSKARIEFPDGVIRPEQLQGAIEYEEKRQWNRIHNGTAHCIVDNRVWDSAVEITRNPEDMENEDS